MSAVVTGLNQTYLDDNFVFSAPVSTLEKGKKAQLSFPLSVKVKAVACGAGFALFLTPSGVLFSKGIGSRGQLGHGDLESRDTPEIISALQPVPVVSVACGFWHCACLTGWFNDFAFNLLAILDVGDVYTWGSNEYGQLGLPSLNLEKSRSGNDPTFFSDSSVNVCAIPSPVDFPNDANVTEIACGSRHTACLTEAGELFTFGWNGAGQLGFKPQFSIPEETAGQYAHVLASDKPHRVDLDLGGQWADMKMTCGQWSTFVYRQAPF
ncbi:unnamed protein product [Schistocephalus solidus]|uniref:RCC1/BLIP-II n=1 Tax=Schistocephalus solidus TaxID=70667 RepID=A0A183TFP1_SCHSO|nr:unnamed protein product [Schistocephalus solidus]